MANIFKRAIQRHNIKKEDSVHMIIDKIKQGKFDATDEKIISYCIEKTNNFYDVLDLLDNLKIDIDKYLNHLNFVEIIASRYADCLSKGDFFGIKYYDKVFSRIKEREDFKELISDKINIDGKMIDESIIENGTKYLDENILSLLKENGYLPFRTIDDFDFIFQDFQQNFYEIGLIDEYVYEKMIIYKLNKYLNWINSIDKNVEEPNLQVIDVNFEIKNDTVRYWTEQSKKLGFDAIDFIMKYIESQKENLEQKFEIFGNNNNALFNNFIPQKNFFNCTDYGFPIRSCFPSEYQNFRMIDFLANNQLKYNELYKKYFELYKKINDEEDKIYYINLLSGVNNFDQDNLVVDKKKINEKGITEEAYKSALCSSNFLKVIFELDDKWMEHYNEKELHYIKILNKNPYFIQTLLEERVFQKRISANAPVTNFIDLYFDKNGFKKDFFMDSKPYFLQYASMFRYLDELKIDWEQYYTKKELHYIKYSVEYSDLKNYDIKNNIDNYFDDNGIKPELVNWCFINRKWDCLLDITDNLNNKLVLSKLADAEYKILLLYNDIDNMKLKVVFQNYVTENINNVDLEKIDLIKTILQRVMYSNSSEMRNYGDSLINELLNSNNPLERLDKIEQMFLKNNIPFVGKAFSTFEIIHPNFVGFNFEDSTISPVLKKSSNNTRKIVVFSDLIKASFGSNNRSVNKYLKNIEVSSLLYEEIKTGKKEYDKLNQKDKKELDNFFNHLLTMYNNTKLGKKNDKIIEFNKDVISNITKLKLLLSPNGSLDYNLQDRIVSMFFHFAGFDTIDQIKNYIKNKIKSADLRNRNAAKSNMELNSGDLIKGIGDIKYLRNILQNGSVSKEYLNANVGSDYTPLDTDLSMILNGTIEEQFNRTAAKHYGPIWFVLKNDDRFVTTRTDRETLNVKNDMSKLELFYTGAAGIDHYGIRTGFASSEINYIVMDNFDPRVGLEIAMNGFYIPIADKSGKIIFTPQDYDNLREKMSGMTYYENNSYNFSDNLVNEDTTFLAMQIDKNNYEIQTKRTKINEIIKNSLEKLGLHLKTIIDGDLTEGFVELIDTGSTGRGTNKPGDGDFDFMMRLDKFILSSPSKLNELKQTILKNLGKENSSQLTGSGDFRLKNVQIDNEINVDIDITFVPKTDKLNYSTDMALRDRLTNVKNTDSEKYKYVIANILLAKQVLKQAEVYKPNRGENPQGGLGGVGIENWILQNGGSFVDAAKNFLKVAEGKDFESFKNVYYIWDFGDNHMSEIKGTYPNDNFVSSNMNEIGYNKMQQALIDYLKQYHKDDISNSKK